MHLQFLVTQISERQKLGKCLSGKCAKVFITSDPWFMGQCYPFSFCFSEGVNPSSLMNLFTYEKGFCFVSYLSQLCGDIKRFDSFLRVRNMTFTHTYVSFYAPLYIYGIAPEFLHCVGLHWEVQIQQRNCSGSVGLLPWLLPWAEGELRRSTRGWVSTAVRDDD